MEKRFYFPAEFEIRCAKILFKCSSRVWCKRFRGMFLINFLRTKKFNSFLSDLSLCTTVESASKHKKITIPSSTHSVAVCLRFYWICYSESHSVYQLKQSMWWGVIESRVNQLFLEAFAAVFSVDNDQCCRRVSDVKSASMSRKSNFFLLQKTSADSRYRRLLPRLTSVALVSWFDCNNVLCFLPCFAYHFWS